MDWVKRLFGQKGAHRGSHRNLFPVRRMLFLLALPVGLFFSFAGPVAAHKESGYLAFAKLSNTERVLNKKMCKNYGGRPVSGSEPALVLKSGRTDTRYYNVVWFEQHPYVSFKIDRSKSVSGSIGLQPYTIWLCQF